MTSEQFVFWLSGYLSVKVNDNHGISKEEVRNIIDILVTSVNDNVGRPIQFHICDTNTR